MFAKRRLSIPFIAPLLLARFDGGEDTKAFMQEIRDLLRSPTAEKVAAFNDRVIADNFKQRDELRTLRAELDETKKKVPAEGAVVLTGDDAKAWPEYQKLGKPEDVAKVVTERDELKKKDATREHETAIEAAAAVLEYNPKVLKGLKGVENMKFEVVKEKVNGEDTDVVYVTGSEQGAQRKKLDEEHVEATWPGFLPALQAEAATPQQRSGATAQTFPIQQPAKAPKGGPKPEAEFRKATEQTASYTL